MANVGIVGAGAFGTAMACVMRRAGHDVLLWAREAEVVDAINRDKANPHFLPGVPLDRAITATGELSAVAADNDFILMAVPAQHMRTLADALRPSLRPGIRLVSCSKGVERGSGALMPEVLADMIPGSVVAVLSGPSFAREIATGLPCAVVLACADWSCGDALGRRMTAPGFSIQASDDVPGTALAGAMKNVIAIASGIAHGRGLGDNARATIVTYGLAEAARLGAAKGGKAATFMGLAGAGDFMLTAHSLQSRNTSLGVLIGQGRRAAEVLRGRKEVTEGAQSVEAVAMLAEQLHVTMPVTHALDAILNRDVSVEVAMAELTKQLAPLCRPG